MSEQKEEKGIMGFNFDMENIRSQYKIAGVGIILAFMALVVYFIKRFSKNIPFFYDNEDVTSGNYLALSEIFKKIFSSLKGGLKKKETTSEEKAD